MLIQQLVLSNSRLDQSLSEEMLPRSRILSSSSTSATVIILPISCLCLPIAFLLGFLPWSGSSGHSARYTVASILALFVPYLLRFLDHAFGGEFICRAFLPADPAASVVHLQKMTSVVWREGEFGYLHKVQSSESVVIRSDFTRQRRPTLCQATQKDIRIFSHVLLLNCAL